MATSEVSICSNALRLLGQPSIGSFTDDDVNAGRCAELWPHVRDWLLRKHAWNCAIKRVQLAPDSEKPAFGFAAAFSLPDDWLRTWEIGDESYRPPFKVESRKVLADVSLLKLRYVWRNEEPETWDSHLVWVATLAMKAALAYPTTASATLAQECRDELARELQAAKSIDGTEEDGEVLGDFPLIQARF